MSTRVSDYLIEDLLELWRVLREISRAGRGEVTPEQFWLLRTLRGQGPANIGELAERLGIMSSSVTAACKRLEQAGLVRRERQSGDERVVRVSLTDEGQERIDRWRRRRRDLLAHLIAPLNEEEQAQFHALLARVLSEASHSGIPGAVRE